jgi:hypothetical protein
MTTPLTTRDILKLPPSYSGLVLSPPYGPQTLSVQS